MSQVEAFELSNIYFQFTIRYVSMSLSKYSTRIYTIKYWIIYFTRWSICIIFHCNHFEKEKNTLFIHLIQVFVDEKRVLLTNCFFSNQSACDQTEERIPVYWLILFFFFIQHHFPSIHFPDQVKRVVHDSMMSKLFVWSNIVSNVAYIEDFHPNS